MDTKTKKRIESFDWDSHVKQYGQPHCKLMKEYMKKGNTWALAHLKAERDRKKQKVK